VYRSGRKERWELPVLAVIVAIAAIVRVRPLLELDRFGLMGYDQAAYFAGGRALTRGFLPYKDFVHIQPPGVLVALAPFSLIGSWGFTIAKVMVAAIGGGSTALLWRIARPWCGPSAAAVAALAYALNRTSVGAHRYLLIDPFVTLLLLGAIVLYTRNPSTPNTRRSSAVGLLLGLAVGFKFSAAVVVVAFVLAVILVERRRSDLPRIARGFGFGGAVMLGPFVLVAGLGAFMRQAGWSQAGRDRSTGVVDRLLSTYWYAGKAPERHEALAIACIVVVLVALILVGWTQRSFLGVLSSLWLGLGTVFVLVVPQFFEHYGELVAPPLGLLVGAFVASSVSPRSPRRTRLLHGAGRGLAIAVLIGGGLSTAVRPLPAPFLHVPGEYRDNTRITDRTIPADECVVTDSPEIVLALPDLIGYAVVGDGPTVDPFAAAVVADTSAPVPPASLERFQRSLSRCPWFAAPRFWSARTRYPGWTTEMQTWFNQRHELAVNAAGIELWRRR
jgi:hypothetical protein